MRLDQALAKIGVEIVDMDTKPEKMVLLLRVHTDDPSYKPKWADAASRLVQKVYETRKGGTWSAEVSKLLMTADGQHVKFFWRVILAGHQGTAQRVFGEAVLESLRAGVEITSMPLVGQVQYEHNPAEGKIKGGYGVGSAGGSAGPGLVSSHFVK